MIFNKLRNWWSTIERLEKKLDSILTLLMANQSQLESLKKAVNEQHRLASALSDSLNKVKGD